MILRQKIPCYVIVFEQTDVIKRSLNFLINSSSLLDIIIIENRSMNSTQIKKIIEDYGKKGQIKRHYLMHDNVTGNAFGQIIETEAEFIKKSKYILLTDGDVDTADKNWLSEEKKVLKNKNIFACGISLDMSNLPLNTFPNARDWIPSDISVEKNYIECITGVHLLLMRSVDLLSFMVWKKENELPFVDGNLHKYCYDIIGKKWARTKKSKAYHITWDLYQDKNHPYTKFKLSKTFKDMWHHDKESGFTLTEY